MRKMQFSVYICWFIFFCLADIAIQSNPTKENQVKDVECTGSLIRRRRQAFGLAIEAQMNPGQLSLTSSGLLNFILDHLHSVKQSSAKSRGFNFNNQKLLALVDFILGKTEGRHFYFLYDHLFEDIADPVTRLMQREGDVAVFKCNANLVELEAVIRGFYHVWPMRNIFLLCSSQNTVNVFKQITIKALESNSVHWFVILKENITADIGKVIREGTQVSTAVEFGNIYEFANSYISKNDEVIFSGSGCWQWHPPTEPLSITTKGTFTSSVQHPLYKPLDDVYGDFGGRVLRSAVVDNPPFFDVDVLPNGHVLPRSGIDYQIITTLSAKLNFSYELVVAEDGQWGVLQPNGTFSGMIGKVEKGFAHFAINEITINAARDVVVDFTLPYFLESSTLVSPAPHEKNRAFAVFSPFTWEVWLMIAVSTMLMGPIIAGTTWLRSKYDQDGTRLHHVLTVSFTTFRSLVNQGNLLHVRCFYQRLIFMAWFVFCFLIYALYGGTLTAVLTVPAYEKPIDSLRDLLIAIEEDGYKPVVAKGTSIETLFKKATSGIYKRIWELFTFPEGHVVDRDEGTKKVLMGKYVFLRAELGAIIRAKRIGGLHKYHFARNTFYPQSYGIACTSGAPYKGIFETLNRMCSAGLIQKWTDDEIAKVKSPEVEGPKGPEAFSFDHLQATFFILFIGFSVALGVLITERLYYKKVKKDQFTKSTSEVATDNSS